MQSDFTATLAKAAKTYPINYSGAANNIVYATPAGKFFTVYYVYLQSEGVTDITFMSGATALSGAFELVDGDELTWSNGSVPLFRGRAAGDDFIITTSDAIQINGFAVIAESST